MRNVLLCTGIKKEEEDTNKSFIRNLYLCVKTGIPSVVFYYDLYGLECSACTEACVKNTTQ